jgi:hypothetical protein
VRTRRAAGRAVAMGLAAALAPGTRRGAAGAGPAAPAPLAGPDAVAVARALNGAWNAGQIEGVVALFAADAVIRQVGTELTPYQGTTAVTADDVYGTTRFFPDVRLRERDGAVVWASGTGEIRAWVSDLVARRHVAEATDYRLEDPDGAGARWAYRVFVAPYRDFRDVPPTEGMAELRLRDGRITTLTLASSGESVRRRERALLDIAAARFAGRSAPAPRDWGATTIGPWVAAAGLSLGGVVVTALLRHPTGRPAWEPPHGRSDGTDLTGRPCADRAGARPGWHPSSRPPLSSDARGQETER